MYTLQAKTRNNKMTKSKNTKKEVSKLPVPTKDDLFFVPLGGAGEIGMNCYLYGHDGKWLMVDLGITFADERLPGIEVILPDVSSIVACRDRLAGIVITHAHEDHIGAVQYLWPELKCKVYATPFSAAFLRDKLAEAGLLGRLKVHEIPLASSAQIGPFDVNVVSITHSIPEANGLIIKTPAGTLFHTGDWKLDPAPLGGRNTDEDALRKLGSDGVTAMMGDSTNAMLEGHSGSESKVKNKLAEVFAKEKSRIIVTCFASNVARLHSITSAAVKSGRKVALIGRSLWRIYEVGQATGYFKDIEMEFLDGHEASLMRREDVVLICTGSQGEARSALARIAIGEHPEVSIERGDTVIFSSREIPGNERAIAEVQNKLISRGIKIITTDEEPDIHVSGHPAQEELRKMYGWVKPKIAVPMHAEYRHMLTHAKLATECEVPDVIVPENGQVIKLTPGKVECVGSVHSGRLAVDGRNIVSLRGDALRYRQKMMYSGAVVVSIVIDKKGKILADPSISIMGVEEVHYDETFIRDAAKAARKAVEEIKVNTRRESDIEMQEAAKKSIRRKFMDKMNKKPVVEIQIVRLS